MRRLVTLIAPFLAVSCQSPPRPLPHPRVVSASPAETIEILKSRAHRVRDLSALVEVAIDGDEFSGTIQLVAVYRREGMLHLVGTKSLLISDHPIFELTFTRDGYCLVTHDDDGGPTRDAGPLEEFPGRHGRLASLYWVREAMFLPGDLHASSRPGSLVTAQEVPCQLELDPSTLAVRSAQLRPAGLAGGLEIRYLEYEKYGEAFLPTRVEVRGSGADFGMLAAVVEIEVNTGVDESIFEEAVEACEAGSP